MNNDDGLRLGTDGVVRCWWCGEDPLYVSYHDTEWGRPQADDRRLFEKLCLEGFMAGLSWLTILRKRPTFRAAFADFDHEIVAAFGPADVERLMNDTGIVRNRAKIEATINNATLVPALVDEFGSIAAYADRYRPADRQQPVRRADMVSINAEATAMSKDLRRRGWRFVGPTTVYSFMQAMGLVNDHVGGCAAGDEIRSA